MLHHALMDADELLAGDGLLDLVAAHDAVRCLPMTALLATGAVR